MVVFEDVFNTFIKRYGDNREHEDLGDNEYYVSGLSINWREIKKYRQKIRYNKFMYFGEQLHNILGEMLGEDYEIEVPMRAVITFNEQEFIWRGRADAIGDEEVVEFKTTSKIPATINNIPLNYLTQLQVYMWVFGKPRGQLIFLNRGNLKIRQFTIPFNPRWIELTKEACYLEYYNRVVRNAKTQAEE